MPGPATFAISPRVLAHFADLGLPSFERLCAHAGLAPTSAFGMDEFFRLWTSADELLGDRAAGLRFGAEGFERGYAAGTIVALHAPDFGHALATLARYKRLTCPELIDVAIEGSEAVVRYRWLQATAEVPRLLVDTTLASLQELARRGTGGRVVPVRVELARRPRDQALLRRHFGCPIVFSAPSDALVFDRRALDVPFVTADGGAFARVLDGLEERLRRGEGFPALIGEVRVSIARQLSEGRRPSLAQLAHRLATSARTLQRRLEEGGTSFHAELAAVRHTTAGRLLAHTELDPVAIALLLGFVEPNSFARAFRAWERTTPLRWRERHAEPDTRTKEHT